MFFLKNKGFSLIELLLVVGIAAGIFLFSFPYSLNFFENQLVLSARSDIIDALQKARHNAILQKNDSDFGVTLSDVADSFVLFQGTSYATRETDQDEVYPLSDGITISGLTNVVFSKLTGSPSATGTINVNYSDLTKGILVEDSGIVSESNPGAGGGAVASGCTATGGTITSSGGYAIHTFRSSGTFEVTSGSCDAEVLVVAGGGGGGGSANGGGGGAGGVIYEATHAITAQSYSVTVGDGGSGGANDAFGGSGSNGENSVFDGLTAVGGGGGSRTQPPTVGLDGGSGGGAGGYYGGVGASGGSGTVGQGNNGGSSSGNDSAYGGGGGGGAGEVGSDGTGAVGGDGGDGVAYSISGSSVYYGGGGGGGSNTATDGAGGLGGGGHASNSGTKAGTANTGGGGGGSSQYSATTGGAGGSGVVIIKYLPLGEVAVTPPFSPTDISGLSTWLDLSVRADADGTAINTVSDLSGNSRNFTGNATIKTNILNGLPVARLTSSQTLTNTTNYGRPITIFYVARQLDTSNARLLSGVNNNWLMGHWGDYKEMFYAEGWVSNSSGSGKDTNWHIWVGRQNNTTCYMWDGSTPISLANPTAGTQGPNGLAFTGHNGTSERSNADLAELIVYDSALSDSDVATVTDYLKTKYGL